PGTVRASARTPSTPPHHSMRPETRNMNRRTTALIAGGAIAALALAGCIAGDPASEAPGGTGEQQELTIGVFDGWDEGIATSLLWEAVLEEQGYDVTLEYASAVVVFEGLAAGDYDFTTYVWLPDTHAD